MFFAFFRGLHLGFWFARRAEHLGLFKKRK
jgi:hypothetical protein